MTKNTLSAEQITKAAEPVHPLSTGTTPLRILVVDDNIMSAKVTVWTLESIGHKPTMVHNGLDALYTARKLQPDVIILDKSLPDMDGYNVCRELRKDPLFKNTILIALTGWERVQDRQQAQEAGFNHHLGKSGSFEELSQLLSNIKITPLEARLT